ncbi:hypothetical protein [Microbacterium sp. P01]|uniref:hypothetical protein n=1 Tax=unclassified Microbacterium TaxID=2609290 RepID=UPI00366B8683
MTANTDEPLYVVSIIVDAPITKLDALDVVAFVADSAIEGAGTAHPRVRIGAHAWAEVEIPKFADPPPLAIDIYSHVSLATATAEAARLQLGLERVGWSARPDRPSMG